MSVTGEADGRAGEGRRRGRRPRLRAAGGGRDRGRAGRARAHRRRPPRRGLAARLRADLAAQPGLGLGVGRRAPAAARQPPPEHRAVRDLRGRRPRRSPSRAATTACSRGCARRSGCPTCRPTSASRPTPRASRTATSWAGRSRRCSRRSPPPTGSSCLRAAGVPGGPDQRRRRGLRAGRGARPASRSSRPTASPLRPPLRLDGSRPSGAGRRRARRARRRDPSLARRSDCATRWRAAASAWRIVLGSMKRTSSRMTSNSATSSVPRARKKSTSRWTSSSGALAPEVMPTTRLPSSHSSRTWRLVVDQVRVGAVVARDVDQALRVGRVAASR